MKARKRAKTKLGLHDPVPLPESESAEHLRTLTPFQLAVIAALLSRPGNEQPGDLVRQAHALWDEASKYLEPHQEGEGTKRFFERLTGKPIPFSELIRDRRIPSSRTHSHIKSVRGLCDAISDRYDDLIARTEVMPKDDLQNLHPEAKAKSRAETADRVAQQKARKDEILAQKAMTRDEVERLVRFQIRLRENRKSAREGGHIQRPMSPSN